MTGECACGAVKVALKVRPEYINFCNCSLCSKSGGGWCYCREDQAEISGETSGFQRNDIDAAAVELRFCPNCGTTTHWVLASKMGIDRMGVNIRIFDPQELAGIETRFPDGRNWDGKSDYGHLKSAEPFDPTRHA